MKHIDLFSGIGGFALAADRVFGDVEHIFVENDEFCQQVLKKHWPEAEVYGDIREFDGESTQIVTGGFPCQPFSVAGRKRGTADNRYLWPEMLRVIRESKPEWVIAENVPGLLTIEGGLVFEQVCVDLESEGYEVQPFIIPAVALNALHRRDRLWIIAHNPSLRWDTRSSNRKKRQLLHNKNGYAKKDKSTRERRQCWFAEADKTSWYGIITKLCRVPNGIPKRLDRSPRLKALGNAIVPQVAEEIMKAIKNTPD